MSRPCEAGYGKPPGFLAYAALDQAEHGVCPGLINIVLDVVSCCTGMDDSKKLRRAFRRREVNKQGQRLMAKLAPDVGSADLIADTLDPRFKRDTGQLPVASTRNPVPNGDPDVLHDIVHIAGSPDTREPRSDVTVHPIDRDHDLVDLDDGFSRRRCASQ
ncbi:hypothetical protein CXZ05_13580 [Arthrobacter sp. AFG20]|nr:hypothetical protein CXZ05_13580 [Arthrobacter sp. AFG20]SLK04628.1 hypothetical protein SAMN06272721_10531 [Arthrobacter sp. P2b]